MRTDNTETFRLSRRNFLATTGAVVIGSGLAGIGLAAPAGAAATRYGLDYAFLPHPSSSSIAAAGYSFVCRYLSTDTTKNLTPAEAQSLIGAGIDIVSNWEAAADAALSGYAQGVTDATAAASQASTCGMPKTRPIYFSVDFDATSSDLAAVEEYFRGVASVLGLARTGAYGGYYIIEQLFNAGLITWGWQTSAWSSGNWWAGAQIQQFNYSTVVDGVTCDEDRSSVTDFGQWGTPSTTNTPKRTQVVSIGGQGGTQSQIAAIGVNDLVYHDIRNSSGGWSGWEPLKGFNGAADFSAYGLAIATMPDSSGSSQIIATGLDGMIYHNIRNSSSIWSGWEPVIGFNGASHFAAGSLSIAGMPDGSSQLTATGIDTMVYHTIRSVSGIWAAWEPVAGYGTASHFSATAVTITGMSDGSSQVAATAMGSEAVYHNIRLANGHWQGWAPMAGFNGATYFETA